MIRIWFYCVLVTQYLTGEAIQIAGSCPELVPPTHFYTNDDIPDPAEIIILVPFSSNIPTNIFKNDTMIHSYGWRNSFMQVLNSNNEEDMTMELFQVKGKWKSQSIGRLNKSMDHIQVESSVVGATDFSPSKCYQPLKENIWMWLEDNVIIIWSCRPDFVSMRHEEAAIFLVIPEVKAMTQLPQVKDESKPAIVTRTKVQRLKEVSRKYLSDLFYLRVNWTEILPQKQSENVFVCPQEVQVESRTYSSIIIVISIVSTFVIIVVVVFWCKM